MKVQCRNCGNDYHLDDQQIQLIDNLKNQGSVFGMIQCKICGLSFSVNPQSLEESNDQIEENTWRSPISGSHGFVSYIEDGAFYGCSETGVVWFEKANFYRDIELIIKKDPHRSSFYEKRNRDWFPSKNEPTNIEQLINNEEVEEIDNYER